MLFSGNSGCTISYRGFGLNVIISNPPKALILLVALICITVLLATNSIDQNAGLPMISAIVFYGIGNGVAAKTKQDSPKMFKSKDGE